MNVRNLAIWGAIALLVIGMAVAMGGNPETASAKRAKLSEIYTLVDSGQVSEATLGDDQIIVKTTDGKTMVSELRALDMSTQDYLRDHNVPFTVDADSGRNNFASLLFSILPILLIVGFVFFMMRDMFEQAKRSAPCIIFIDEIDAVGRSRGAGLGGGNDEREQTLNQLLVEMDGFEANEGIILIAATNRPDVLDPALLRPGRFDRQVTVGNPDILGREKILRVHMRNVPLAKDVDAKTIARGTPGFSGADLANLVNEAALLAARRGKRVVAMQEFEDAKDKVLMGPERRSMVMSEKEKELTAWHEAGHAIVAMKVPAADPVHKATIIPRGRALGMVMQLPEDDKLSMSKIEMTSRLAIMMGGRVAEELKFGDDNVTAGAASDIQQATRLARAMVTRFGLSDEIGPVDYGSDQGDVFLGQQIMQSSHVSEDTSRKIEEEVRELIQTGMDDARRIMTDCHDEWSAIANGLLEYETLTGSEITDLLNGKPPTRPDLGAEDTGPASAVPAIGKRRKPKDGGGEAAGDPEPNPA